jgi:hypothetical protein
MSAIQVWPFRRSDREQLTKLVNAHAAAVVPGMAVSVNTVLTSLERRPGEFIEDPWVSDRATLVAEQQGRVAAAAHLLRHYADERAGAPARNSGDISWLLFWPEAPAGNPFWTSGTAAADALIAACLGHLGKWGVADENAILSVPSWRGPDSASSPAPGEAGPGLSAPGHPDRWLERPGRSWPVWVRRLRLRGPTGSRG